MMTNKTQTTSLQWSSNDSWPKSTYSETAQTPALIEVVLSSYNSLNSATVYGRQRVLTMFIATLTRPVYIVTFVTITDVAVSIPITDNKIT